MKRIIIAAALVTAIGQSHAQTLFSFGAGSAVTTIDRSATFDALAIPNIDLTGYTENLLAITALPDGRAGGDSPVLSGFSGGYYAPVAQDVPFVSIRPTDTALMFGVEFAYGNWVFRSGLDLIWETYRNGNLVGSGLETAVSVEPFSSPPIVGWQNAAGFDELRVWTPFFNVNKQFQVITLDNLNVELLNTPIPEPSTVVLLGVGFVGLVAYGKRRRSG